MARGLSKNMHHPRPVILEEFQDEEGAPVDYYIITVSLGTTVLESLFLEGRRCLIRLNKSISLSYQNGKQMAEMQIAVWCKLSGITPRRMCGFVGKAVWEDSQHTCWWQLLILIFMLGNWRMSLVGGREMQRTPLSQAFPDFWEFFQNPMPQFSIWIRPGEMAFNLEKSECPPPMMKRRKRLGGVPIVWTCLQAVDLGHFWTVRRQKQPVLPAAPVYAALQNVGHHLWMTFFYLDMEEHQKLQKLITWWKDEGRNCTWFQKLSAVCVIWGMLTVMCCTGRMADQAGICRSNIESFHLERLAVRVVLGCLAVKQGQHELKACLKETDKQKYKLQAKWNFVAATKCTSTNIPHLKPPVKTSYW